MHSYHFWEEYLKEFVVFCSFILLSFVCLFESVKRVLNAHSSRCI